MDDSQPNLNDDGAQVDAGGTLEERPAPVPADLMADAYGINLGVRLGFELGERP